MKSPFPGMDPYIEASGRWRSFHSRLISRIVDMLEEVLPAKYRVLPEEREVIELVEEEGKSSRSMYPDAGISGPLNPFSTSTSLALLEQVVDSEQVSLRPRISEEFREQFIEIVAVGPGRRLVTSIEILSPTNKRAGTVSWALYLRKRQALLLSESNLVEIDLLRGGEAMPMHDPWPDSPYRLLVSRGHKETTCRVWPASFRKRLPVIVIPLDATDPEIALDLQPMIDSIYERSRFHEDIDYTTPLDPPLNEVDRKWLQEQLQARQG